jgi:hypothetical protein
MNGYPDETILKQIENWDGKDSKEMIRWIYEAWNHDYGSITKKYINPAQTIYTLITGGWSGNEEVMSAITKNLLFDGLFWKRSERGGLHVYEVYEVN